MNQQMLPEQKITSFSQEAILHRWKGRMVVDVLFAKKYALIKMPDGKMRYPSRKERENYDRQARQLWRSIIIEANKL